MSLHERYHLDGRYDSELRTISAKMDSIEQRHGLKDNQYWAIKDAPPDYQHESQKYDAVLDGKLIDVFRKFAPSELLDLLESDPNKFWALYERGRRSIFEQDDYLASIIDLIDIYENEAKKCVGVEAYYAAIAMLGSAAEARILPECLRQPAKVRAMLLEMPRKKQPRSKSPLEWTLNELIYFASQANWLPNVDDVDVTYIVAGWVHRLRLARNMLHPGRHTLDKPHAMLGKEEWMDAHSAYVALLHSIDTARKARRASSGKASK